MATDSVAAATVAPAPGVTPPAGTPPAPNPTVPADQQNPASAPAGSPAAPSVVPTSVTIGDPAEKPVVQVTGEADGKAVKYDPTGDAKLDMSLAFLGKLGIAPDHPGMLAAGKGDFSILKAHLSTMGDTARGWEANVALGESAYAATQATHAERASKDRTAIYAAAGGEETWKAVKDFAALATADTPAEREAVNAALNGGGLAAVAMAAYLTNLYHQKATTKEPASATVPNAAASAPAAPTVYALSPREYTAKVKELAAKLGGRLDGSPEYAELGKRRQAWRAR